MIYLGLGSNLGDRRHNLSEAILGLKNIGFTVAEISPIVESPALLTADAKPEWNRPYLNLVLCGESTLAPHQLLKFIKEIETSLGRDMSASSWSPRPIDIDILLWHDEKISTEELTIPHAQMYRRSFVITPLLHLAPNLVIPGIELSPLQISQNIRPIPLWMGIVNLTPDSFSDGGDLDNLTHLRALLESWIAAGVQLLDLGAESTRPNGHAITEEQEWERLEPALKLVQVLKTKHSFMPRISIDTRHAQIAKRALSAGADWINDVSGLSSPSMQTLAKSNEATVVAMHSLSVPVDPSETLPVEIPTNQQMLDWLEQKTQSWRAAGIDLSNIVIDPGVGFGKTITQNLDLIKATKRLRNQGFRVLVGHSRKSFMRTFSSDNASERDMETLGLSLAMCEQGVDILRVHDPIAHMRAYIAWAHATQT